MDAERYERLQELADPCNVGSTWTADEVELVGVAIAALAAVERERDAALVRVGRMRKIGRGILNCPAGDEDTWDELMTALDADLAEWPEPKEPAS